MKSLHGLLARQLQRHLGDDYAIDDQLEKLLLSISEYYKEADVDRSMLERSLDISSKELCQINNDLKSIFDSIPDALLRIDKQGKIIDFRDGSETILNIPSNSIIGENILSNDNLKQLSSAVQTVNDDQIVVRTEQRISEQGITRHFETRLMPVLDDQILVMMRDITQKRNLERQDVRNKQRLEIQNKILSSIANNLTLLKSDRHHAFYELTEASAIALDVEYVSIWIFNHDYSALLCHDSYKKHLNKHDKGQVIQQADQPDYFEALLRMQASEQAYLYSSAQTKEASNKNQQLNEEALRLNVPVKFQDEFMGIICYETIIDKDRWSADEMHFATSMADMVSLVYEAYEKQRVQKALKESEERFRILTETTDSAIFAFRENILYVNPALLTLTGYKKEELIHKNINFLFKKSFIARINDFAEQKYFDSVPRFRQEIQIYNKEGKALWLQVSITLMIYQKQPTFFVSAFDITKRKLVEEELREHAFHDKLTGLANRMFFMQQLERCIAYTKRNSNYNYAILFLDIDRFKTVNDSLGHIVGDEILIETGKRLKKLLRETDTIARFGGDEFTILIEQYEKPEHIISISSRIQKVLSEPYIIEENEVNSSVSIGIAIADLSYKNPEDMLRDADIAMYKAKAKGKARHEVFNAEMHADAQRLLHIEIELHKAIREKIFRLYYQPIVCLTSGATIGYEGLIRWQLDNGNFISPVDFIPIAEETGKIIPLGQWVIDEACRQLAEWAKLPNIKDLSVNINLSSKQFAHTPLISDIQRAMEHYQIRPENLKLELTESTLVENSKTMLDTLTDIKSLGIKLLIDDFGTGYSSLSYLQRLPIDALKIDRSFVADLGPNGENSEIIKAIIQLAHSLGLKVVAEGVETELHLQQLKKLNCDYAQGYYFSKPIPAESVVSDEHLHWAV